MKKLIHILKRIDTTTKAVYICGLFGIVSYITVYFMEHPIGAI